MVGQLVLVQPIGVRIPASEPDLDISTCGDIFLITVFYYIALDSLFVRC